MSAGHTRSCQHQKHRIFFSIWSCLSVSWYGIINRSNYVQAHFIFEKRTQPKEQTTKNLTQKERKCYKQEKTLHKETFTGLLELALPRSDGNPEHDLKPDSQTALKPRLRHISQYFSQHRENFLKFFLCRSNNDWKGFNMLYLSTQFDNYLWQLILRWKQKKNKKKTPVRIQSSYPFSMVGPTNFISFYG